MSAGRLCQRQVDTVNPDESARVAAQRMASRGVGALVVVDGGSRPIGMITDRDIAIRIAGAGLVAGDVPVVEVMSGEVHSVSESTPIEDCLRKMRGFALRRLPVVDDAGELVGILTMDDVLSLLAEEMTQMGRIVERTSPQALADR